MSHPERYEFGGLVLDAAAFQLLRDGLPVPIQPKALELLLLLVRQPGKLLERTEIARVLWPDVHVTEQSLRQLMRRLRSALGEEASLLETVPTKGVRFSGALRSTPEPPAPEPRQARARLDLPSERDPFYGRARELAALDHALAQRRRLVTVTGPAGMGKTRLVVRWASLKPAESSEGIVFCDLVGSQTIDDLVHRIAVALGLSLAGDRLACLGNLLKEMGPLCLVLDNFEQFVPFAEATVGAWLDRAPVLSFVVTSRQRLGIGGEVLLPLESLEEDDGVALFEDRARAQDPVFREEPSLSRELVALLDGIPLAIELAASRQRLLGAAGLIAQMADRFRLLAAPRGDRHATLLAALDLSWELLGEEEKRAFCALSVFEGEFDTEAAAVMLDCRPLAWPLDLLQALLDRSLLRAPRPGWFSLLPTLAEYGARRLEERGPSARREVEERHERWASSLFDVERSAHLEPEQRAALRVYLPDLLAACRRAVDRGNGPVAVATAWAAWAVVTRTGPYEELARLIVLLFPLDFFAQQRKRVAEIALEIARSVGGLDPRPYLVGAIHASLDHPALRATLLVDLADFDLRTGREGGQLLLEEAMSLVRGTEDRNLEARVHVALADHAAGEEEAVAHFEGAMSLYRATGNRRGQAVVHQRLGSLHADLARLVLALEHQEIALTLFREMEHGTGVGMLLHHRAQTLCEIGRHEAARVSAEESIAVHLRSGAQRYMAQAQLALSRVLLESEAFAPALQQVDKTIELFRRLSEAQWLGWALQLRASVLLAQDRVDEAWDSLWEAGRVGHPAHIRSPLVLLASADLHAHAGDYAQAHALFIEAESRPPRPVLLLRARILCNRARVELLLGEKDSARVLVSEATAISERAGQQPTASLARDLRRIVIRDP